MQDLNDAIILACATQGGALPSLATEQTGLSRVAVSRRLQKLVAAGYLQRHGTGTRPNYSLGQRRFWLGCLPRLDILRNGGEMAIWERHVAPLLDEVRANVKSLANTAFTEMLGRHPLSAFRMDRHTFPLGKMFGWKKPARTPLTDQIEARRRGTKASGES